jgi:hypothetical protein
MLTQFYFKVKSNIFFFKKILTQSGYVRLTQHVLIFFILKKLIS